MGKQIWTYIGTVVAFAAMYIAFTVLFYREALRPELILQALITGCIWVVVIRLLQRWTRPNGATKGKRER